MCLCEHYLGCSADSVILYFYSRINLARCPSFVVEDFEENGWQIWYVSDMKKYCGHEEALGATVRPFKKIYLKEEYIARHWSSDALLHEMGHFAVSHYDLMEQAENCYKSEAQSLATFLNSSYCTKNADEFFATAFSLYMRGKDFHRVAPAVYQLIEDTF